MMISSLIRLLSAEWENGNKQWTGKDIVEFTPVAGQGPWGKQWDNGCCLVTAGKHINNTWARQLLSKQVSMATIMHASIKVMLDYTTEMLLSMWFVQKRYKPCQLRSGVHSWQFRPLTRVCTAAVTKRPKHCKLKNLHRQMLLLGNGWRRLSICSRQLWSSLVALLITCSFK
jgi:hypothetical protein